MASHSLMASLLVLRFRRRPIEGCATPMREGPAT